jgi:hypothetical protein
LKAEIEKPVKGFNVPMVGEIKYGKAWGDMHLFEFKKEVE